MLTAVFLVNELLEQDEECISFVRLLMRDVKTVLISNSKIKENRLLDTMGIDLSFCVIVKFSTIESFLHQHKEDEDNWFFIVTNSHIDFSKFGKQFVGCPYRFWGKLEKFDARSFTEHAKTKLLYHELSWLYMDSIVNDTDLEVNFLREVFETKNVEKVIDCCCGVGRHAAKLGEMGFKVIGIDASKDQIQTAIRQRPNNNVNYLIHDARDFSLPEKKYDAAICIWTTYNYFSKEMDMLDFLHTLWSHLRMGGILILDSKNIPILDKKRLYHRRTRKPGVDLTLLVYKRVLNMVQNSQYFYFVNRNGDKHFYLDEEFVRFYTLEELESLNLSGFKLLQAYGDFYGGKFDSKVSERMITVWEKCDDDKKWGYEK